MSWTLDKAREEVAECKRRCREAFRDPVAYSASPFFITACWNYHNEVRLLHEAEARVRFIETQERANGAVNDNGAEEERARPEERGGAQREPTEGAA